MKYSKIILILVMAAVLCMPNVSIASIQSLRNVEREESYRLDTLRSALTHLMWLPRQTLNASLDGIGKSAAFLSDPEFIEKVEDILYLYKRELAWFPMVDYTSGFRPRYGGGLYYNHNGVKALFRGSVHDADQWSMHLKTSYMNRMGDMEWKVSLEGLLEKRDDFKYYGIGADPQTNHRNRFINLSDQDYGVFTQEQKQLKWTASLDPTHDWRLTYTGYYDRKGFDDTGTGDNPLRDVFDLTSIPGFTTGSPVEQIYNEIAIRIDTRDQKKILSPGLKGETYFGFSAGLDENPSNFIRTGGDLAVFIPTIKEDRLIVPRITLDVVESANDEPIPFTEYPRHRTFRGVSSRELIHNDEITLVSSVEYQWPLSHIFSGHIFFDYLVVGDQLTSLQWNEELWATGFGINLQYEKKEIGKIEFAGGTEGFQMKISIGVPIRTNHR